MRRRLAGVCVVAAFLVCCARASNVAAQPMIPEADLPTPADAGQPEELTNAIARFQARDYAGAMQLLREAAKKSPDVPLAQVMMARLSLQSNALAAARSYLEQAVIENPDDPDAYAMFGDLALRERRITEADLAYQKAENSLAKFEKSLKRKTDLQPVVFNGLASVAEARENWAEAQRQLAAWLKFDPKNVAAIQRLARCLVQQKKIDEALQELQNAAKVDPDGFGKIQRGSSIPEAILAQLCEQAGDREAARKYMLAALAAAPQDVNTQLTAARWAFETEQLDEAETYVAAAMKLDPKSFDGKILCGMIAAFKKDYRTAEAYFEQAHLQSTENFVASNNLALALVEQKDESRRLRALKLAEENARRFSKSAEAISTYGWVLYKSGQREKAYEYLRAVVFGGAFSPDIAYYLARVDADLNRPDEAKMLLMNALKAPGPFAMRQEAKALLDKLNK